MAKSTKTAKRGTRPPTTMRLDPDLVYRAKRLALENEREGRPEKTASQVVNAALAAYFKQRGA